MSKTCRFTILGIVHHVDTQLKITLLAKAHQRYQLRNPEIQEHSLRTIHKHRFNQIAKYIYIYLLILQLHSGYMILIVMKPGGCWTPSFLQDL